ncbi:glycine/betaine ABC transporter ATPase [Saccharothrix sp. NRRL B-16348]|uniref:ABC transporter ATP-binding protein n=1 Tax=Saccharothrix sp. NRRL B-16348 TaxID=1415542 RepID=UPI0006B03EA0|nr:ABC transporter ATP-binding protein [Saccharothrix sp. NRRL B-16348]KOX34455.1 glycine/betaine ABC transporter ATPase [Saccharothrix sp. NRRL B-16348]
MISFEAVNKKFADGTTAVRELDMEIPEGQLTVLVGSSGCGKTTTLRMINRMIDATSGQVRVDGRDVRDVNASTLRRNIGYVIQQSGLFPHRTVADNIATVPRLLGWDRKRVRDRVVELLDTVGLARDLGGKYPHQLSGGQQQRVGVARALAADPPVLLMDEPFGAVDPVVRTLLQDELLRLQDELHKTIVFVTHDIDEAVKLGDRIAIFKTGGHLVQFSTPAELLAHPADDFVADFLGSERGLKLLSLTSLADVPVEPVTTVTVSTPVAEARRAGDGWVLLVTDDHRPRGWLHVDHLPADGVLADAEPIVAAGLTASASLLTALDATVSSPVGLAVRVDDDGRVVGVSSHQRINERAARFRAQVLVP